MKSKLLKIGLLLIAAVMLVSIAFAGAASAEVVTAKTLADVQNAINDGNDVQIAPYEEEGFPGVITIDELGSTLDLNGRTVTASEDCGLFYIADGASFTLSDSTGGGKLVGNGTMGDKDGGVYVEENAVFNMTGGTITNCNVTQMDSTKAYGGGVYVDGGKFNMSGGIINNCNAFGGLDGSYGGGVYVGENAVFNMTDGTITNCTADYGGGVYVYNWGKFNMTGGTINNCTVTKIGGGVFSDNAEFNMTDGVISNCSANKGGGVYIVGGTFAMGGGSIENCTVTENGGGVYSEHADNNISGTATITGNTNTSGGRSNLFLDDSDSLHLVGAFTGKIGVTVQDDPAAAEKKFGVFVSGSKDDAENFFADENTELIGSVNDDDDLVWEKYEPPKPDYVEVSTWAGLNKSVSEWNATGKQAGQTRTVVVNQSIDDRDGADTEGIDVYGNVIVTTNASAGDYKIDGNQEGRIFSVKEYGNLTLIGNGTAVLNLTGGKALDNGGSIDVESGNVTLAKGAKIINCSADMGGGVYIEDGTFNLTGGSIENCNATNGGGVYVGENAVFNMSGGIINNCNAFGGLDGSYGGGVHVEENAVFNMTGGTITNCTADSGGGVYVPSNCIFTMNNGTITNCSASNNGGGVYVINGGTFNLTGGSIENCTADYGGGVNIVCLSSYSIEKFNMTGGNITNCTAYGEGGGVYFHDLGERNEITLDGGCITNCSASLHGGGVYVDGGKFNMNNGTIANCYVLGSSFGAGIYIFGTFNMTGGNITKCRGGGGVYICPKCVMNIEGPASITENYDDKGNATNLLVGKTELEGNGRLNMVGGLTGDVGVMIEKTQSQPGGIFGNASGDYQGAERFIADDANLVGSISNNKLVWATGPMPKYVEVNSWSLLNEAVSEWNATGAEAGKTRIVVVNLSIDDRNGANPDGINVYGNVIVTTNASAGDYKIDGKLEGRLFNVTGTGNLTLIGNGTVSTLNLTNGKVGSSTNGAGIMVNDGGTLTLSKGAYITNCQAPNEGSLSGGVAVLNGTFIMNGGNITNCTANSESGGGGGVYVDMSKGTFILADGCISNCSSTSDNGGAVYVINGGTFNMTGGSITNCTANSESSVGGGVYVKSGMFNMTGGTITNCSASSGGAVYVINGGTFNMTGGSITNCSSTRAHGGAVYVDESGAFNMTGGTIINCSAQSNGGGVYVGENAVFNMTGGNITNCTAYGEGGGGGVYVNLDEYGGIINISGTAQIIDNIGRDKIRSNLYLHDSDRLHLVGDFTGKIGVTVSNNPAETGKKFGVYGSGSKAGAANFFADKNPGLYGSVNDDDELVWTMAPYVEVNSWAQLNEAVSEWNASKAEAGKTRIVAVNQSILDRNETQATAIEVFGNVILTTVASPAEGTKLMINGNGVGSLFSVDTYGNLTICGNGTGTTLNLTGGCVQGVRSMGGGVYVMGTLVLSDGAVISNCTAPKGGGVYIQMSGRGPSGTFIMNGGSIENCSATMGGGGVYYPSGPKSNPGVFKISGTAKIAGNWNSSDRSADNVYLMDGCTLTIVGPLTTGAQINVTTAIPPAAGIPVNITSVCGAYNATYFGSDNANYVVGYNTSTHTVQLGLPLTVTYNGNGNTSGTVPVDSKKYKLGESVTVLGNTGNLVKTGYNFTGWENATHHVFKKDDTFTIAGETTLKANWTANVTTVKYHNVSEVNTTLPYTYNKSATLPEDPTRKGYTFRGWNVSSASGPQFYPNATYFDNDMKWVYDGINGTTLDVYGNWTGNITTVTFVNESSESTGSYAFDAVAQDAYKANKTGHTFLGWFDADKVKVFNATGELNKSTKYANGTRWNYDQTALTVWANFTANMTTLNLDPTAGTGGGTSAVQAEYGNATLNTSIKNPTRVGYTFSGWNLSNPQNKELINTTGKLVPKVRGYTDENGKWVSTLPNGSSMTVYANWTANTTTVDFYNLTEVHDEKTYTFADSVVMPAEPTRVGYQFAKWNVSNGANWEDFNSSKYNKDGTWNYTGTEKTLDVSANWTANTYNVTFHSNNGTDATVKQQFTYDVAENLQKNAFTYRGYAFVNWSTNPTGTGANYTDGQAVKNLNATQGGNVDLYAQWKANTTKITLDPMEGIGSSASVNATFNSSLLDAAITNPQRPGYTFVGWNVSADTELINLSGKLVSGVNGYTLENGKWDNTSTEVAVYANWTANTTTVTFYNLTDKHAEKTYTFGQAVEMPEAPTRIGHDFIQWNVSVGDDWEAFNSSKYNNDGTWNYTGATNALNVYAEWSLNSYNITYFNTTGGLVNASSPLKAPYLSTVTVDVIPDSNYNFKELLVVGNGTEESVESSENTFVMPAFDVNVTAVFEKKSTPYTPSPHRDQGQTVIQQQVPVQDVSADPTPANQATADITVNYVGQSVLGTSTSDTAALKEQYPEAAAQVELSFALAMEAGVPLTNSKGAKAVVVTAENIPNVEKVTFSRVYEISPANEGEKLTKVTVKVPKTDITSKGLTSDDVTVYHYLDTYNIWVPLETLSVSSDADNYYYTAATDGTSPFGVLVKKIGSDTTVPTTNPTQKSPAPFAGLAAGLGAAALVLARMRR